MTRHSQTHYETLGVSSTATPEEIKRAFRDLARRLHPDVNAENDAAANFAKVQAAYEVIGDEERRRVYDERLALAAARDRLHGEAGSMHFTWSNIADRQTTVGRTDDELFDEIYKAFFEPRVRAKSQR